MVPEKSGECIHQVQKMNDKIADRRTRLYHDQGVGHASSPPASYKGIPEQSRDGLLAHVTMRVSEIVSRPAKVLEIAAGSGALALRLQDAGYDVQAADYVEENFRPHGKIPFKRLDLNTPFAARYADRFDAITATEIIEHLENPHHFLRETAALLKPTGILFLTTPNVDNPVSRALALAFGHPQWFSDKDYKSLGHISPITVSVLTRAAKEAGFHNLHLESFANPWDSLRAWPRMRWYARVVAILDRAPKHLKGEILVAILRRN